MLLRLALDVFRELNLDAINDLEKATGVVVNYEAITDTENSNRIVKVCAAMRLFDTCPEWNASSRSCPDDIDLNVWAWRYLNEHKDQFELRLGYDAKSYKPDTSHQGLVLFCTEDFTLWVGSTGIVLTFNDMLLQHMLNASGKANSYVESAGKVLDLIRDAHSAVEDIRIKMKYAVPPHMPYYAQVVCFEKPEEPDAPAEEPDAEADTDADVDTDANTEDGK